MANYIFYLTCPECNAREEYESNNGDKEIKNGEFFIGPKVYYCPACSSNFVADVIIQHDLIPCIYKIDPPNIEEALENGYEIQEDTGIVIKEPKSKDWSQKIRKCNYCCKTASGISLDGKHVCNDCQRGINVPPIIINDSGIPDEKDLDNSLDEKDSDIGYKR